MTIHPNRTLMATAVAACLGLAGALAAGAADAQAQGTRSAPAAAASDARSPSAAPATGTAPQAMREARASKLIGMNVRTAQGESAGEIKDLIVDVRSGRVHHAVLASGGFLGMGDKLFAYPMGAFKTSGDRDDLVLNVDKARLKDQPGFEANRWPNLREYGSGVDRFFARLGIGDRDGDRMMRNDGDRVGRNDGDSRQDVIGRNDTATGSGPRGREERADRAAPGVQGSERADASGNRARTAVAGNPNLRRASELIGRDVRDSGKRKAGEIEDLVVRLGDGRIHYVVVDFDKAWSPDDKLLALPMSALRFGPGRDDVMLAVPRERLDMARGFDENRWPDLNDPSWRAGNERTVGTASGATAAGAARAAGAATDTTAGERARNRAPDAPSR